MRYSPRVSQRISVADGAGASARGGAGGRVGQRAVEAGRVARPLGRRPVGGAGGGGTVGAARPDRVEPLVGPRLPQRGGGGEPRARGARVAVEGAGLGDVPSPPLERG